MMSINQPRGKRGIALVVVLGMLALLVMMGVTFSIFMRTEREAAGSFQHEVRAHQLLYVSMAEAVKDINEELADTPYPPWNYANSSVANPSGTLNLSTNDLWAKHVPDALLVKGWPARIDWIDVPNGRIAYLIYNASGLVDANAGGGAAERTIGINPSELELEGLPGFKANGWTALNNGRFYQTITELKGRKNIGLDSNQYLSDFSLFMTNGEGRINIGLPADKLKQKKGEIVSCFAGYTDMDEEKADMAFEALCDYVDEDSDVTRTDIPCVEKVPMINEARLLPVWEEDEGLNGRNLSFIVELEMAYPFMLPRDDLSLTLDYKVQVSIVDSPVSPAIVNEFTGTTPAFDFVCDPNEPFKSKPIKLRPVSYIPYAGNGGNTVKFNVVIPTLTLKAGGKVIDEVRDLALCIEGEPDSDPSIHIPVDDTAPLPTGKYGGSECIDPRYNHLADFWIPYVQVKKAAGKVGGTLGGDNTADPDMNVIATYFMNKEADGDYRLHVADRPIRSLGELTYIPRGGSARDCAWKTFRYLEDEGGPADPISTSFYLAQTNRGLINPNTDLAEVLATALRDMRLDRCPDDPKGKDPGVELTAVQATTLANAWIADPTCGTYWDGSTLIGNSNYLSAVSSMTVGDSPQLRREAAFRNLLGLMNPRQNYFIVALFAQSSAKVGYQASTNVVNTIRAEQQAILELWRDPKELIATNMVNGIPDVHTNYPMIIRRFDVLTEN